jgi:nicotinate phosphoribosyltransferase
VTAEELHYLRSTCSYLNPAYLSFLQTFRLQPLKQVRISYEPQTNIGEANEAGELRIDIVGRWVDTILYEVPLLSLTSEAYFRFCDREWTHSGQESLFLLSRCPRGKRKLVLIV